MSGGRSLLFRVSVSRGAGNGYPRCPGKRRRSAGRVGCEAGRRAEAGPPGAAWPGRARGRSRRTGGTEPARATTARPHPPRTWRRGEGGRGRGGEGRGRGAGGSLRLGGVSGFSGNGDPGGPRSRWWSGRLGLLSGCCRGFGPYRWGVGPVVARCRPHGVDAAPCRCRWCLSLCGVFAVGVFAMVMVM